MRVWFYTKISQDTDILAAAPGKVHSASVLTSVPELKPFIVCQMGELSPEIKDNNQSLALSVVNTVWVHDVPGDYLKIDDLLDLIRNKLERATHEDHFIQARYLETSVDFPEDPELGTISKFSRFQLIHTP